MSDYPTIEAGLGKFTPAMWDRLMRMMRWFEEGNVQEHDLKSLDQRVQNLENNRGWFFAKLLRAHVLDHTLQNPNAYEYAWVEVSPGTCPTPAVGDCPDCNPACIKSRNPLVYVDCCAGYTEYEQFQGHWEWVENPKNSSWGNLLEENNDGVFNTTSKQSIYNPLRYPALDDFYGVTVEELAIPYTKPAINIFESFNTYYNASGVEIGGGIGDFMMQAIGGGDTVLGESMGSENSQDLDPLWIPECFDIAINEPPCTQYEFPLKTTPIVMMYNVHEPDGTVRQMFQEANSYDGTCVSCS